MSPNDFSLSVHNTSSGLFSIFSKNTHASTAVAAGPRSLDALFFEMWSNRVSAPTTPLLAVIGDMPCPIQFGRLRHNPCYALAFLFAPEGQVADVELRFRPEPQSHPGGDEGQNSPVEEFLRWSFRNDEKGEFQSSDSAWQISRKGGWAAKFCQITGTERTIT